MNTVILIKTERIVAHTGYSRVIMDRGRIDRIRGSIQENGRLLDKYALKVRAIGDGMYQVIDGHIRLQATEEENLSEAPCIVVEKDDFDAYMALIEENGCQEISALDIGIHALAFELEMGGSGKQSELTIYAKRIGRDAGNVRTYRKGAEVYKYICHDLKDDEKLKISFKAIELSKLTPFAKESWVTLARIIINPMYSNKDFQKGIKLVKHIMNIQNGEEWINSFCPYRKIIDLSMRGETSHHIITHAFKNLNILKSFFQDNGSSDKLADLHIWLRDNAFKVDNEGRERFKYREIVKHCMVLMNENIDHETAWIHGDCRDNIWKIKDNSVSMVLTDPPYGCNYRSISGTTIMGILNDTPEQSLSLLQEALKLIEPKMKDDSTLIVFSGEKMLGKFINVIGEAGFTYKSVLVWKKYNHTQGDIIGGFRPITEKIIYATKGNPIQHIATLDFFEYPNCRNGYHATEKPVQLLQDLINAMTVEGDLVVDPFAGSGSTIVAAKEINRKWWGCVLEEVDWENGRTRIYPVADLEEAA